MAIISGIGVSSGINYDDLISGLMQLQRQPITRLQSKQSACNQKISVYNQISSKLSALKSAADKLRTASNFYTKTASVSDSTVMTATAASSAVAGNYTIGVHSVAGKIALASEEKEVHSGAASTTTVVNSSGSDQVFQYTYSGTQRTLTVADGTTLEGLRDLINNDSGNPGVTAAIFYDGSNYRLSLTGNSTGSTKTISIDAGTTLNGTGTVDFRSTTFTQSKTASDAKFSIDGIDITSGSNTISDVIGGVTLTLKKESTSSVTVSITNDTSTMSQNIQAFVNAYNDLVSYISSNSAYDSAAKKGGAIFGESTPKDIVNRMEGIMASRVTGLPEDMRTLAQIGISTNRNGTLTLDTGKLNTKLSSNLEGVADIFTDSGSGIAKQAYDYIDNVTDTIDGAVTIRTKGLSSTVKDISDDIAKLEERMDRIEQDLRRQFASLESLLGGISAIGSFLTNQETSWTKG